MPGSDADLALGWNVLRAERICSRHTVFLKRARAVLRPEQIIWLQMEEDRKRGPGNIPFASTPIDTYAPLCLRGTEGHEFHIVSPAPGEPVFLQQHPCAFHHQSLRDHISAHGITVLSYTGVVESRSVTHTLITGSALGYNNIVLQDLVGGPEHLVSEMEHARNVNMFFYANYMSSTDFLDRLAP